MSADNDRSIAEQIDEDPSLVGVTAAEDRDDTETAETDTDGPRPTWGDVWSYCSLSGVVSKTQAATALEAHPDTPYRSHKPARDRLKSAIEAGDIVQTGAHGTKIAVEEDSDEYV